MLESVGVNAFHAMELYSSVDPTEVKYIIRRLSIVETETVIACRRPNNVKGCKDLKPTC
jgi:hypothetical protein